MKLSDFHFDLPESSIAQHPLEDRAASRLLVLDRKKGTWRDRVFRDLPEYLGPGDCLVVNDSRVLPARLIGRRPPGGGAAEALLLKPLGELRWEALGRPAKKLKVGARIEFGEGLAAAVVSEGERGVRTLQFDPIDDFFARVEQVGHVPLPPYIRHEDSAEDRERYQTVYAKTPGSAAAPTAGLHFTPEVLEAIDRTGADRAQITLHVGLGTFQPVQTEDVEEHAMHSEVFEISAEAAEKINRARRVVAVGTTSTRTLEHGARQGDGVVHAGSGETDIFLRPGSEFRRVDALITNFHLPESTLIMLVAAFAGRELTLDAYRHAVREGYRFYSYGDAMLIL